MSEEKPITVQIMDMEYRVACPPDEEGALQSAARYLNDTMLGIRDTGKVLGSERIAVMAALNISYELFNAQKNSTGLENTVCERTRNLLDDVDEVLRAHSQNEV